MKLILTFILMLLASTPSSENLDIFNKQINDGYEKYEVLQEKSNIYYTFKVVRGINNDKMSYGVFLFNLDAKSHRIVIGDGEKSYTLKTNSRGDYLIPAVALNKDVRVYVVDENDNEREYIDVLKIEVANFKNLSNLVDGLNEGLSLDKLKAKASMNLFSFLIYVFAGVSIFFGGLIFYMFIAKKGVFSPVNRQDEVFNFREYVQNLPSQEIYINTSPEEVELNTEDEVVDTKPQVEDEEAPIINMYPYQREYDDDDEINVKELLIKKGYSTDYQSLSEEDRNTIMLALMLMRDMGEISRNQYQKEIIELWKK